MAQIKATRMGLLLTKRKLKLATKGHKLLKEKRDALIMEFFKTLREIKDFRKQIGGSLALAEKSMHRAQAMQGEMDVERFALGAATGVDIEFTSKNIMSVQIPDIGDVKTSQEWFGYHESTVELDSAVKQYREIFPALLKLSAKQLALNRLAEEIKKTKRKVNSLEYIIIPGMEEVRDSIAFKLEERERESFTRLKKIKERAEKTEAEKAAAEKAKHAGAKAG
ncbi:MAG: V-type ATP synthase subunit D [Candidatus Diapherotrites archaeon]|nr:V-type ATP synthase subunit D [Candidatus Micrarchaeota archaeon]MBU1939647.1 V-type ATP synthase subunit D [Candidatus Micrarchaeota archaeon]